MADGLKGVAISTTGDPHRMDILARCVEGWRGVMLGSVLVVTVDGSEADAQRVKDRLGDIVPVYRVGHWIGRPGAARSRMGVAANKNTGIEILMSHGVQHLFLSDDDCWPLFRQSLDKHIGTPLLHSMVCWGQHRLIDTEVKVGNTGVARWKWPRGVMLYARREVIDRVGGMDERFGPGGHEHAEWSTRIHNAGLTPAPFCTPASYAQIGMAGPATRADALWHCEDMPLPGEAKHVFARRKAAHTSIQTTTEDWERIGEVMAERKGSRDYVPYVASYAGRAPATWVRRASATLSEINRAEEPETHER